jgi:hypothetical protein
VKGAREMGLAGAGRAEQQDADLAGLGGAAQRLEDASGEA